MPDLLSEECYYLSREQYEEMHSVRTRTHPEGAARNSTYLCTLPTDVFVMTGVCIAGAGVTRPDNFGSGKQTFVKIMLPLYLSSVRTRARSCSLCSSPCKITMSPLPEQPVHPKKLTPNLT